MEKSVNLEENLNDIKDRITKTYSNAQAIAMNPLALAYIGDGIYSDLIRKYLLGCGHQDVNLMTKTSINYVRASAQALVIRTLLPELTETETRMFKRGRNTASQVPKNAAPADYRYATGFETLIGYLYLCGNHERMHELIIKSIAIINNQTTQ